MIIQPNISMTNYTVEANMVGVNITLTRQVTAGVPTPGFDYTLDFTLA